MKRVFALPFVLLAAFCGSGGGQKATVTPAGHGIIKVSIAPNPIVARPVTGNGKIYEFPFDVVIRETGGHPLTINGVTITVYAFGLPVNVDRYTPAQIEDLGGVTHVPANGELHFHLHPQRAVTDESLFDNITAGVRIEATDDTSATTSDSIRVGITR